MLSKSIMDQTTDSHHPYHVFIKEVKSRSFNHAILEDATRKDDIDAVTGPLMRNGEPRRMATLLMDENCVDWIEVILSRYPNVDADIVKYLVNDFAAHMHTKMKEPEKYVTCLLESNVLALFHSSVGKRSITPGGEVFERLLDKDNIIRFVRFEHRGENILVTFKEKGKKSLFFLEWLGLPDEQIGDIMGVKNTFKLSSGDFEFTLDIVDDDLEAQLVSGDAIAMDGNVVVFKEPISEFHLHRASMGRESFANANVFLERFHEKRNQLTRYKDAYCKLRGSLDAYKLLLDELDAVVKGDDGEVLFRKTHPKYFVVFSDELIRATSGFANHVYQELKSSLTCHVFHAGMSFRRFPVRCGKLFVYNQVDLGITKPIIDFLEAREHVDGRYLVAMACALHVLKHENDDVPIYYFLDSLASVASLNAPLEKHRGLQDLLYQEPAKAVVADMLELIGREEQP